MTDFALQGVISKLLLEGDNGGWVQLLVFAVIAAVYGIANIARAKKQKFDDEPEEQRPVRRPPAQTPHRPATQTRDLQPRQPAPAPQERDLMPRQPAQAPHRLAAETLPPQRTAETPRQPESRPQARRTIIRPGSALAAFVAEIKRAGLAAVDAAQDQIPAPSPPEPQPAKPLPAAPAKDLKAKSYIRHPEEQPPTETSSRIPLDFSGPDALRAGILYYEILGKPVSLRQPGEHPG